MTMHSSPDLTVTNDRQIWDIPTGDTDFRQVWTTTIGGVAETEPLGCSPARL